MFCPQNFKWLLSFSPSFPLKHESVEAPGVKTFKVWWLL